MLSSFLENRVRNMPRRDALGGTLIARSFGPSSSYNLNCFWGFILHRLSAANRGSQPAVWGALSKFGTSGSREGFVVVDVGMSHRLAAQFRHALALSQRRSFPPLGRALNVAC